MFWIFVTIRQFVVRISDSWDYIIAEIRTLLVAPKSELVRISRLHSSMDFQTTNIDFRHWPRSLYKKFPWLVFELGFLCQISFKSGFQTFTVYSMSNIRICLRSEFNIFRISALSKSICCLIKLHMLVPPKSPN